MKAFVVYPTYRIIENKAYVYLFGRLEDGESFLTINHFKPYFWNKKKDINKAKKIISSLESIKDATIEENTKDDGSASAPVSASKNFEGDEVVKIILTIPKQVSELRKNFVDDNIPCYEADIRFAYRFMIDHGIKGIMNVEGKSKKGNYVDNIFEEPTLSECKDYDVNLKTLSIDIETNGNASEIFSIALYTKHDTADETEKNVEKKEVLIISKNSVTGAKNFPDEKTLLEEFLKQVQKIDPDFILGWNVIDFDLAVIKKQCAKYKIPFVLGRAEWESSLRIFNEFFKSSDADIAGRQVLDGIEVLKGAFIKLDDYKLDTAAHEIIGKGKTEHFDNGDKRKEIEEMFKKDKERLAKYNMQDAVLVTEILEKKDLINLTIQRSKLTGMQPDRVNSSIASLDNLYLRETMKRNLVCPTSGFAEREERIKGGYVKEGKPGIYEYVIVLDFKSLYPSIIRTFNIDPYSHDKQGEINAPNGARFRKEQGILPLLIQRLWQMRDKAKQKKDDVASYAIKITMNSFFGVLANPNCRFYSIELGNAITHFGQAIVKETAEQVEGMGYTVIYSDTDSIFVDLEVHNFKDAEKIGLNIQQHINTYFEAKIKKQYNILSFLELEFEKVFKKFILPNIRGTDIGAK